MQTITTNVGSEHRTTLTKIIDRHVGLALTPAPFKRGEL